MGLAGLISARPWSSLSWSAWVAPAELRQLAPLTPRSPPRAASLAGRHHVYPARHVEPGRVSLPSDLFVSLGADMSATGETITASPRGLWGVAETSGEPVLRWVIVTESGPAPAITSCSRPEGRRAACGSGRAWRSSRSPRPTQASPSGGRCCPRGGLAGPPAEAGVWAGGALSSCAAGGGANGGAHPAGGAATSLGLVSHA
jgi:hypothetical protein